MNLNGAGIMNYYYLVQGAGTPGAIFRGKGLDIQKYHRINIPHYQRPYRWGEGTNISNLFEDYKDNRNNSGNKHFEYFVGASVAVEKVDCQDDSIFDIIDGQQRLTTIFLMNYLLFLLGRKKAEHLLETFTTPAKCSKQMEILKGLYEYRVGKNKTDNFDKIKKVIDEAIDQTMCGKITNDDAQKKCLDAFRENLGCVNRTVNTPDEYYKEYKQQSATFFEGEELTLTYSRQSYNTNLKEILGATCIDIRENPCSIKISFAEKVSETDYKKTYYSALQTMFESVRKSVINASDAWDLLDQMIKYLTEVIENLNFCMIITPDPDDANRLFEVLNDRALDVDDLELVKNHFYMVFCSKNRCNSSRTIDMQLDTLNEIWSGKIFNKNEVKKNRLIAYLATVYLTQDGELDNKNEDRFKKSLKEKYTDNLQSYTFDNVQHDFNVFLAMKEIIERFHISFASFDREAIKAENDSSKSITYKTFHLIYALKRPGVLAALSNIILAVYENSRMKNKHYCIIDMDDFCNFLDELQQKSSNSAEYNLINSLAFDLWKGNLLAESHKTPREKLAVAFIRDYGHLVKNIGKTPYSAALQDELVVEYMNWIGKWRYGNNNLPITIMLLNLFQRNKNGNTLTSLAYSYNLNPNNIELDHMEPQNIIDSNRDAYYCSAKKDEIRRKNVLDSLGNMMILDKTPNIKKADDPLICGLRYYAGYANHWMLVEINEMIKDNRYFVNGVPTDEFFEERRRRLIAYIKAVLVSKKDDTQINIQ